MYGHDRFALLQVIEQTTDAIPEGGGGRGREGQSSYVEFDWVRGLYRCPVQASSNHGQLTPRDIEVLTLWFHAYLSLEHVLEKFTKSLASHSQRGFWRPASNVLIYAFCLVTHV